MKFTTFNFLDIKRRLLFGCLLPKQIYIKAVPVLSLHLKGTKNLTRITPLHCTFIITRENPVKGGVT
jgi:hypothetical protein